MSGLCGCPAMIPPPPLNSPATPLREEEKAKAKIVGSMWTSAATLASTRTSGQTRLRRRPVRAEEVHGQFLVATRHREDVRRDRIHYPVEPIGGREVLKLMLTASGSVALGVVYLCQSQSLTERKRA